MLPCAIAPVNRPASAKKILPQYKIMLNKAKRENHVGASLFHVSREQKRSFKQLGMVEIIHRHNSRSIFSNNKISHASQINSIVLLPTRFFLNPCKPSPCFGHVHIRISSISCAPATERQCKQLEYLRCVSLQAMMANLYKSELALDDPKLVFHFGPHTRLQENFSHVVCHALPFLAHFCTRHEIRVCKNTPSPRYHIDPALFKLLICFLNAE
jgi:hypothetical protein